VKSNKYKICFISPKAYLLFNPAIEGVFGGAEVQLFQIGKEFSKKNYFEVSYIVADYGQGEIIKKNGIKLYSSFSFEDVFFIKVIRFVKSFKKTKADIYLQRGYTNYSWVIALLCRICRKRFIFMIAHDNVVDGLNSGFFNKKKFFIKILLYFSELVVAQNQFQKEGLKNYCSNLKVVRSGYEIIEKNIVKSDYVLWVGRSEKWKRPELFFDIADSYNDKNFIMICPSAFKKNNYHKELKQKADKINNLKFIEGVPFDEIDGYFEKAILFVNTSEKEGFPNTFIQSAKNKTPIISLNVNPDNFLEESQSGMSFNNDYSSLIAGFNKLIEDKEKLIKMGESSYEYVLKYYNLKINSKELYKLITSDEK